MNYLKETNMKKNKIKKEIESDKRPIVNITKTDKWISLENEGKTVKIRRNSKQGILLESTLNNPDGIKEELVGMAMERKQAIEKLSVKEQNELIKKWQMESIYEMANIQNRAMVLLTNGKCFIEQNKKSFKLVIPKELQEGFAILMGIINPDIKNKYTFLLPKLNILNDFFDECGIELKAIEDNKQINFVGNGTKQFAQFMKTCGGYDIKSKDLF